MLGPWLGIEATNFSGGGGCDGRCRAWRHRGLQGIDIATPTTEAGLYQWLFILLAGYMAVAVLLNFLRHRSIHPATKNLIGQTFGASTFAASAGFGARVWFGRSGL